MRRSVGARTHRRHAHRRRDLARSPGGRPAAVAAVPSRPVRPRPSLFTLLEPRRPSMAAQRPSSFVCITRGPDRSVALGLTAVFAGGAWLFAAMAAAIARMSFFTWADRRNLASCRRRDCARRPVSFTLVAVEPHSPTNGFPTCETFGSYFRDLSTRRTCCVPPPFRWSRRQRGSCSPSSRLDRRRDRVSVRLALRCSARRRSARPWCSSLRSPRSARTAGCSSRSSTPSPSACTCSRSHQTEMSERRSRFHPAFDTDRGSCKRRARRGRDRARAAVGAPLLPGS